MSTLLPLVLVAGSLQRPHDPVILSGSALPGFQGAAIGRIVAFRYSAGWVQVPVQVDERAVVLYDDVYGPGYSLGSSLTTLSYADPSTWTGPDPDPTFDADDEVVAMASDAGEQAGAGTWEPSGVVSGTGLEVRLDDPLDGGTAFLYLFLGDGSLDPAAGEDRVAYAFTLLSGPYLSSYNTAVGPNPEDSEVSTLHYRVHFSDRWIRDELRVTAGGATGADILDRHKFLLSPGHCARTEETFSEGEGAFFANVDGPLRAVRSYMGANSGPITQRDHFFYAQREDIVPRAWSTPTT